MPLCVANPKKFRKKLHQWTSSPSPPAETSAPNTSEGPVKSPTWCVPLLRVHACVPLSVCARVVCRGPAEEVCERRPHTVRAVRRECHLLRAVILHLVTRKLGINVYARTRNQA